ncbi:MAG TPA: type II secretion system protein N [Allosphingosinicella sp.]|jgi:general secretion pathway protein C
MRLALDPRTQLLLRRVPRTNVYTLAELGLLTLLALQCARLVWAFATPLGPVGDWRPAQVQTAQPGTALLGSFDPFFRLAGGTGPVVVTSLSLKLFGVRQDEASGRGSAIIALPDGTQRSFAVGDEIMPGVTLSAVAFDNVTISRGGAAEQLFMDQSQAVPSAGTAPAPAPRTESGPPPPQAPPPTPVPTVRVPQAQPLSSQINFQPRLNGGKLTGVTLSPQGAGDAFRAAGLQPGDVLIAVNGQRITSPDQLAALRDQLVGVRGASVQVERGGRVTRIQLRNSQ